jgi:hypothetical protein
MAKFLLWLNGLGFAALGAVCIVSPEFATGLSGLGLVGGDAPAEIRAQYGGLFLGLGIFASAGALRANLLSPALLLMLLVYLGLASGRALGVLLDPGPFGSYTYGALAFEIVLSILLAIAVMQRRQAPQ